MSTEPLTAAELDACRLVTALRKARAENAKLRVAAATARTQLHDALEARHSVPPADSWWGARRVLLAPRPSEDAND